MSPTEIIQQIEIPQEDSATPIKQNEAQFLYDFIRKNKIKRTLETGFAYGMSASHIMAATNAPHIAIDPFQSNYQRLGLKNIKQLKLDQHLTLFEDYSHNVLPQLAKEKKEFDFIFIDGDHKFDGELIDFYYADFLIKQEGYVLLHDTWMRSTRLLMSFIKKNRKDYRKIPTDLRNFALYQKTGEDQRNGMHFREFFTFKSIISHNVIMWLSTGESNFLKRLVFKIKEMVK